jgi:hypothetical protein
MTQAARSEIKEKLEKALQGTLGEIKLDHVEIESGRDHDGDAAVFVKAVLAPKSPPIPGRVSAEANVAVAEIFAQENDPRLSYLYIYRPDDERPDEERSPPSGKRG